MPENTENYAQSPITPGITKKPESQVAPSIGSLLSGALGGLILIFLLFFMLNFFNIISLSQIYPAQLGWLPHLSSNKQNVFNMQLPIYPKVLGENLSAEGTLFRYNDDKIQIKTDKEIVILLFTKDSSFYKSNPNTGVPIPYTLYDLDRKENLGKKIKAEYNLYSTGEKIITTITLFE